MDDEPSITLYHAARSRSNTILWFLEELGQPYRLERLDIAKLDHKAPDYLAINPSGKVPAVKLGDEVLTERLSIILHVGDRFASGGLAMATDEPERADYLNHLAYAIGVVEPGITAKLYGWQADPRSVAWGDYDVMVERLIGVASGRQALLSRFTAADVLLGGTIAFGQMFGALPDDPALTDYVAALRARPAAKRAGELD